MQHCLDAERSPCMNLETEPEIYVSGKGAHSSMFKCSKIKMPEYWFL